jgi:hypothetical protein
VTTPEDVVVSAAAEVEYRAAGALSIDEFVHFLRVVENKTEIVPLVVYAPPEATVERRSRDSA